MPTPFDGPQFGGLPKPFAVRLRSAADQNFMQTLTTTDGKNYPSGTTASLVFTDGTTWAATTTGPTISWNVPTTGVAAIKIANPTGVKLRWVDSAGNVTISLEGPVIWG